MGWLEDYRFAIKATLKEIMPETAIFILADNASTVVWPRAKLPPSLKLGDTLLLEIVCDETRELAKASLRRDILQEIIN